MGLLSGLFSRRPASSPSRLSAPVRQMLATQRANTERCISILAMPDKGGYSQGVWQGSRTSQANGRSFGPSVAASRDSGDALPVADLLRVKEDSIKQFKAFLSATEQGL